MSSGRLGGARAAGGLLCVALTVVIASCSSKEDPAQRSTPNGKPIGTNVTACGEYLDRSDLRALFDDPAKLTQSERLETSTFGTCGLYDPSQDRYVLTFDIAMDMSLFNLQLEEGRRQSGAVIRSEASAAFTDLDGQAARALVRLPKRFIFVDLRQGPMTADRLNVLLDIAEKIAATVPAPVGTARATPTDHTDGTGGATSESGRVSQR
jgi:hypothetical protein